MAPTVAGGFPHTTDTEGDPSPQASPALLEDGRGKHGKQRSGPRDHPNSLPFEATELKPWQPREFSDRHKRVVDLHVAGLPNIQIADLLSYTPQYVSQLLRHPDAATYAAEIRERADEDVGERIAKMRLSACAVVEEVLGDETAKLETRLTAAFGVWDRTGHGKTTTEKHVLEVNVSDNAASLIALAMRETRQLEAEYVVEEG